MEAGLEPSQFWQLTPYQTNKYIEAKNKTRRSDYDMLMASAWHNAVFTRVKKLEPLDYYMREKKQATWDDVNAVMSKVIAGGK